MLTFWPVLVSLYKDANRNRPTSQAVILHTRWEMSNVRQSLLVTTHNIPFNLLLLHDNPASVFSCQKSYTVIMSECKRGRKKTYLVMQSTLRDVGAREMVPAIGDSRESILPLALTLYKSNNCG